MKKFARFANMDVKSDEAQIFVAVEDWLNDGVPLPLGIANMAVQDWFLSNAPCNGAWKIDGHKVEASQIKTPSLIVASSKDKLVDYESAYALYEQMNAAELLDPECGHVGMIAGRDAIATLWQPILEWVHKNHS